MIKRFLKNTSGLAAIEFAFIGPVLITMYFGVAELTQAMLAQRRVAHAASTIGDLVAQGSSITAADFSDVWVVGQTIVSPFPTTTLKMRITSISDSAAGATTVTWSEGSGLTPLAKNSAITVPASVIAANQSIIKAEVQYTYTSPVNYVMHSPVVFSNTYYLRPRLSDSVDCADC